MARHELIETLFSVIDTSSWTIEEMQSWADRIIERIDRPASWLLELSLSSSLGDAADAVEGGLKEKGAVLSDRLPYLLLGLLYQRFCTQDLDEKAFVDQVTDILDAHEAHVIDLDAWVESTKEELKVPAPIVNILEGLAQRAMEALDRLRNIDLVLADSDFSGD